MYKVAVTEYTVRTEGNYRAATVHVNRNPAMDNCIVSLDFYPTEDLSLSVGMVESFKDNILSAEWTRDILTLEDYQPGFISNASYSYRSIVPMVTANIDNSCFTVVIRERFVPAPGFTTFG